MRTMAADRRARGRMLRPTIPLDELSAYRVGADDPSLAAAPADLARLIRAVCDKLGQLPPAMINVLVLGADRSSSAAETLAPAMRWLQDRAAQKDETLFRQRGFTGTRDFLRHYQRLSGALWLVGDPGVRPSLWRNPQARHPLPADLAKALGKTVSKR